MIQIKIERLLLSPEMYKKENDSKLLLKTCQTWKFVKNEFEFLKNLDINVFLIEKVDPR